MPAYNYPIATIVDIAYVSAFLSDRDKFGFKGFKGGAVMPDNQLPMLLHMEASLLNWYNTNYPTATDLPKIANYVLGLCANYLNESLSALGNAGGIVINPTTGNPINLAFYRSYFIIGQSGSLMNAGDTTCTIALSGFLKDSIDFFASGSLEGINDPTQPSYTVNYQSTYVIITLNQAVQNGEIYQITGLRATAGTVSGGGSSSNFPVPLPLQKGQFLSNDGSNIVWNQIQINYTSANFEADGKTLIDTRLASHDYTLYSVDLQGMLTDGIDYTTILSGGFTLIGGWDANNNLYKFVVTLTGKS